MCDRCGAAQSDFVYKVVMVGEPAVGKSSLVRRCVYDQFSDTYVEWIGTKVTKHVTPVAGRKVGLQLWDVRGGLFLERPGLWCTYLQGADGIVLTYDCQKPLASWANLDAALRELGRVPVPVEAGLGKSADRGRCQQG